MAYKGSKRKLLNNIEHYCEEIGASTFFDGFSGTGIVGAHMRSKGCAVTANDLNYSSFVYGSVFLNGYDPDEVQKHLNMMNSVAPKDGWLTQNYSGEKERKIRGTNGKIEKRPLGFTKNNSAKIDAARDYIETIPGLDEKDRKALVFSVVLGADKVFNNSNDQKSSLKNWSAGSKKDVEFLPPTLVTGPLGQQFQGMQAGDVSQLMNLGTLQRGLGQSALDANRQSILQQQQYPYQQIQFLSDIYKGTPSNQQTVTATPTFSPSPFQQAAGLGIAGVSAYSGAKNANLF